MRLFILHSTILALSFKAYAFQCKDLLQTSFAKFTQEVQTEAADAFLSLNPAYLNHGIRLGVKGNPGQIYLLGRMQFDFTMLEKYLPPSPENILNIGGGVGLFEVVLSKFYAPTRPNFTLIDSTNKEGHDVVALAQEIFKLNAMTKSRAISMNTPEFAFDRSYDLILSLRAMGFMFSYEHYRSYIESHLKYGGSLIFDIVTKSSVNSPVVLQRFGGKKPESYAEEVLSWVTQKIGPYEILHSSTGYIRIKATRTK